MGRGNRKVVPSCVARAIRKRFPEKNGTLFGICGKHVGFFQPPRRDS